MANDAPRDAHIPDKEGDDLEITLDDGGDTALGGDYVRVHLDASVRQQIAAYAVSNTSCELGGVLIGTMKPGTPNEVYIEAMIEARYTDAVQASITFTHETWQDILAIKDRVYPAKKIVGWFHTHPGFGIFLSRHDLFIQQNFFNLDWQVAYVVDPKAHTEGFFRWEDGTIRKMTDYALIGALPSVSPPTAPPLPAAPRLVWWDVRHAAIVLLLGVVIYQAFFRPTQTKTVTKTKIVTVEKRIPAPQTQPETLGAWPVFVVQPGDSLWTISERCYGDGAMIPLIMTANHLRSSTIYPGMQLRIPGGRIWVSE